MGNRTWLNIGVGQELQVEIDSRKFWNCGAVWLEESGRYDFEVQGSQRKARFEGNRGTGSRYGGRICNYTFVKS
jgi:hypothetical protein